VATAPHKRAPGSRGREAGAGGAVPIERPLAYVFMILAAVAVALVLWREATTTDAVERAALAQAAALQQNEAEQAALEAEHDRSEERAHAADPRALIHPAPLRAALAEVTRRSKGRPMGQLRLDPTQLVGYVAEADGAQRLVEVHFNGFVSEFPDAGDAGDGPFFAARRVNVSAPERIVAQLPPPGLGEDGYMLLQPLPPPGLERGDRWLITTGRRGESYFATADGRRVTDQDGNRVKGGG
jgi:hypothetical protein